MADDVDRRCRVLVQAGGELVQDGRKVGLDARAAGVKRDVARDVQLQAVVGRLGHGDARTCSRLFHRDLLVLHALRPDIAAHCAGHAAQHCASDGTVTAADGRAQDGTCNSANASALRGAALGVAHVGAARQNAD